MELAAADKVRSQQETREGCCNTDTGAGDRGSSITAVPVRIRLIVGVCYVVGVRGVCVGKGDGEKKSDEKNR